MNPDLGAKIVYEGKLAAVDIVFVHGLLGHRFNTWTYFSKNENQKQRGFLGLIPSRTEKQSEHEPSKDVFWPADLLPRVVPESRIITYGYDARLVEIFQSVSQNSLYAISRELINDITLLRQDGSQINRPIVWVTHSLGGLVLKDAMVFSNSLKTKAPHLSHIYESSQGILYLGCPHRGSDTAQYGLIAASAAQAFLQTPNKRFLRSLQTGSSDLERIADAFSLLPRKVDRSLLEFSFQEEKGMASALPLFGGKVVPDASSKLDDGAGSTSSIAANHRDMCRFADAENRDFQRVAGIIRRFCRSSQVESISGMPPAAERTSGLQTFQPAPDPSPSSHLDLELRPKLERRARGSRDNCQYSESAMAAPAISANESFTFRVYDGWTEISKRLINHISLDSTNEDYEDIGHVFLIRRVMSRSEVQLYVERTVNRAPKGIMPTYGRNVNQYFGVPLRSNPCFTGREYHLSRVDEILHPLSKPVESHLRCAVLVGLGGCGKTEIAVRYAHLHRDEYMAVLWIDGTNPNSLSSSFARLGSRLAEEMRLNNPGMQNNPTSSTSKPPEPTTRSFSNSSTNLIADAEVGFTRAMLGGKTSFPKMIGWLNSTHHRYHWLMVVDNLDDPDMVETLDDILLQLNRGTVVITSRNLRAAKLGTTVEVGELLAEEATEFLLRSLQLWDQPSPTSPHQDEVDNLCSLLGYLALAIDQAAAYINENKLSIEEYIELFQQEKAYLLSTSFNNRYSKTRSAGLDVKCDTVLMTWEISFQFIQRDSPASALLLQLLAFMNCEEISEDMFRAVYEQEGRWHKWSPTGEIFQENEWKASPTQLLIQDMGSKIKFHEIVSKLLAFSLVKRAARSRCLSVHPLVHFWASARMEREERHQWMKLTAELLRANIPMAYQIPLFEPAKDPKIPMILPHVQSIYRHSESLRWPDEAKVVGELISIGAYHTLEPLSGQMFAYRRSMTHTSDHQDYLMATCWELSHSCHLGHMQADEGHTTDRRKVPRGRPRSYQQKDLTRQLRPAPLQPPQVAAYLLRSMQSNAQHEHAPLFSAAEKALMVRLAVMLALHYWRHDPKSDNENKNDPPIAPVIRVTITGWEPSEAFTEMELASDALRDFYLCTLVQHDYTSAQEVSDQAVRLVDCFEEFASIRRLCELLSDSLMEYAKHCPIRDVLEVMGRILNQDQPTDSVISPWCDLSQPIADVCSKAQTETDLMAALDVLRRFQKQEWSTLLAQKHRLTAFKGRIACEGQWAIFYKLFNLLTPLKDGKGSQTIASFLRHLPSSEARHDALLALAEISRRADLVSYVKESGSKKEGYLPP